MRIVQLSLVAALAVGGCHKTSPAPVAPAAAKSSPTTPVSVTEESDGEPWPIQSTEFLELIPADTPYVLHTEPIPAEVVKRLKPVLDPMREAIDKGLGEELKKKSPEQARKAEELFGGTPSFAALEKLGIDLNPRVVVYGLGFAPVFRVRLLDAAAFERTLDKLDTLATKPTNVSTFHGQRYRYEESADGSLTVTAVVGPDVVVAVLPPGEIQRELLPLVFGQKLPPTSMAKDDRLAKMRAEQGFGPHLSGYIDVHEIVASVMGVGGELNRRVAAAYPSLVKERSRECVDDAMRLARVLPRIEFGFDELSAKRVAARGVARLSADVVPHTKPIAGPIPGLGAKPKAGSIATFGVGIDMKAVVAAATALATEVTTKPFACPDFASFNQLGSMAASVQALVPKPLLGITGFGMQLDDLVRSPGGDTRMDGIFVLGIEDPKAALEALEKLSPDFDSSKLRKARTPVKVTSLSRNGGTPDPIIADAWMAMGRRSIGMSVGKTGKRELLAALDRQRPGDRDLAVWSFDLAPFVAHNPDAFAAMKDPIVQKFTNAFLALLGRMSFALRTTDRGIETEMTLALPKQR